MIKDDRTTDGLFGNLEQRVFTRKLIASILRKKQLNRIHQELYQQRALAFPRDAVDKTKLQKLCYLAALELDSVIAVFPEVASKRNLAWYYGPVYSIFYYEMNAMIKEGLIEEIPESGSQRVLLRLSRSGEDWFSNSPPQQTVERDLLNWSRLINISNITIEAKIRYLKDIGSAGLRERPNAKVYNWDITNLLICAFVTASSEHPERDGYVTPYFVAVTFGISHSTTNKIARRLLQQGLLRRDPMSTRYGRLDVKPAPELIGLYEALKSRYEQDLLNRRKAILKNKFDDLSYLF